MSNESSTKIADQGLGYIMFVACALVVLAAFLVGKKIANVGIQQFESVSQDILDSRYSDYNNTTITGSKVKEGLTNFANDDIAFYIHTHAMEGYTADTIINKHISWKNDSTGNNKSSANVNGNGVGSVGAYVWSFANSDIAVDSKNGGTLTTPSLFINYGALLQVSSKVNFSGQITYNGSPVTTSSGSIVKNSDISEVRKRGSYEYISDKSQFQSYLITNDAKEIVGILLYEKKLY